MRVYAVHGPEAPAEALEVATPDPVGDQVLLRIRHSGVCHTDTHVQQGGYDLGSAGFMKLSDRGASYPNVAGHEIVGEVVAAGPDATAVREGELRLVYPWLGCRTCQTCRSGDENLCPQGQPMGVFRQGGFAEMLLVPHEDYLVDITGIDPNWAATLACSGVTSYSAVSKVLPRDPGEHVVVIGAGGVGLMAVAMLVARGHRDICVVDVNAERLAMARELGATVTVDSSTDDANALKRALGGPAQAVIDFVNSGGTARLAFDALGKNGKLVQVGLFGGELGLPTALMAIKGLTLTGSYVGNLEELRAVVELARSGVLPQIPLTTRPLDVDEVNAALRGLTEGTVNGRIVLTA